MNDQPNPSQNQVLGRPLDRVLRKPSSIKRRRIVRAAEIPDELPTRLLAGENPDDCGEVPSIVLERDGDTLTRIIVRCPCGRYAEVDFNQEESQ